MDAHQENVYVLPVSRNQNSDLHPAVDEEDPYECVGSRAEKLQGSQSQVVGNSYSGLEFQDNNMVSAKNEKSSNSDKCTRIAIAILSASVLGALMLSLASLVMLLDHNKQMTPVPERNVTEIKVMQEYFQKQKASNNELYDVKLNRSLRVLIDQMNKTQENIQSEIRELKEFIEKQQVIINESLSQGLEVQHQVMTLNKSLNELKNQTKRLHENIRVDINEMKVFDETRDLKLNESLIEVNEKLERTQEINLLTINKINSSVENQQGQITQVQMESLKLDGNLTFLRNQFIIFNKSTTSSFVNTETSIDELRSAINETKAEFTSWSNAYVLLNNTIQQYGSDIEQLYQLAGGIRLVGGSISYGRVEIFYNGTWGTICDDDWNINDAIVVCRMLGYQTAKSAPGNAMYGQGSGQIWLDNVGCTGKEPTIHHCSKNPWGLHNCRHSEDASVVCSY